MRQSNVAHTVERRDAYRNFVGKCVRKRDHLEHLGIDVRVILKWIL
jgi:hypothetical protein